MLVNVIVRLMVHESESKFYETVEFACDATGRFTTVRRWGKMSLVKGDGQIKYEQWGSARQQAVAGDKLQTEKTNPSKTGGPYLYRVSNHGISTGSHDFEHDMLDEVLSHHYADPDVKEYVLDALSIDLNAFYGDEASVATEVKETAVPKVEPVRAQDWASR